MNVLKNILKNILAKEPVRVAVVALLGILLGGRVATGKLDADMSDALLTIATVVLGVGAGELTRARVTPTP
ncbi:hypothetical protein [Rhodococcus marinonascens]|uniref:hypothetical protein n=1 Tax=Rhodococcus marinonascens TaxID=38311 RepID=UPI00093388C6|nr:hypothetical protein [Rhodococcus marinonascens]